MFFIGLVVVSSQDWQEKWNKLLSSIASMFTLFFTSRYRRDQAEP